MKDSLRISICLLIVLLTAPVSAQKEKTKAAPPANPIADARSRTVAPKQYADSAEFAKTFKEFYPLVKPKGTIREFAERQVDRQIQALVKQGADSTEVVKVAYAGLDEQAAYSIYYEIYREKLSAKELKAYLAFLKTPEGAKIQAVNMELNRAPAELTRYVTQAVNTNLMPIRTTVRDKVMKEQKAREELLKSDTTETGRQYRQQMQMRDSIMKARGITPPKM